ncbi:hypothetical protein A3Q56_02620 [Intoshia linei]|uniref:Uncharacterized protein n=1 Tax=Intoshia linei TaxID=1819745 RepID=A0A177B5Q5_9BILA|nr:hypothetical protein A3Q56_02620 [Intoshia linei]
MKEIASKMINSNLLEYAAVDVFFKCSVCKLCVDVNDCMEGLNVYASQSQKFLDSREFKFIDDLANSLKEKNYEEFDQIITNYNKLSRLEPTIKNMLNRIKENMNLEDIC